MLELQSAHVIVNGKNYTVDAATTPLETSLNTFLRTTAQLRGTKFMCLEGGCGACIVVVRGFHPSERTYKSWSVNSCLTPIFACHGLEITTVEGVGNRRIGYHAVQKRLTAFNGTQCGFCSPGMVMNMVGLLDANCGQVTMAEVENSFGGNICRCTGYRPILDAFKSLAVDADAKLLAQCAAADIEDLPTRCPSSGRRCDGVCRKGADTPIRVQSTYDGREWCKVFYVDELFDILATIGDAKYMLVAGNTAHGVYRRDSTIERFIHIADIEELRRKTVADEKIVLGANVSLSEMMVYLREVAKKYANFAYCEELVAHVDLIANVPVRNSGTIAGNLSIKHQHREFPSDLFLLLDTVGAQLTIGESLNHSSVVSVLDYLDVEMRGKVLLNVILPCLPSDCFSFRSYKVMPRAQNAHAYVNGGFLIETDGDKRIVSARICFGGIEPNFTHAMATEKSLLGTQLHRNDTVQLALQTLRSEMHADWVLPNAAPAYRTQLALALFYRFVLATAPPEAAVSPSLLSGGVVLQRPISSGQQDFDTVRENYPLTEPVPKYDGMIQCAGEAEYVNDMPSLAGELWAAFVPATEVNATVTTVDAAAVLAIAGIHGCFTASDIPGTNSFYPDGETEHILLAHGSPVLYHGQPVALIVADSFDLASAAAAQVRIVYAPPEPNADQSIITTLHDVHEQKAEYRYSDLPFKMTATHTGKVDDTSTASVSGVFDIGSQYHYTMETQTAICTPSEESDGLNVYSATQWVDFTQRAIAAMLRLPNNAVNMQLRRIGGGYGAKITRAAHIACAAALACRLTCRPVRFVMTLESNMAVVGRRYALISEYTAEVDKQTGRIRRLNNRFTQDYGSSMNEPCPYNTVTFAGSCYATEAWDLSSRAARTNAPGHTWCRAPGSTEGIAMTENIMEHIAAVTGLDPLAVRVANMVEGHRVRELLPEFLRDCEFVERQHEVDAFNAANRWHKRGIAVVPMDYAQEYFGNIPVLVAVYHADGSVAVTHGGIECGQGINTKAAQVAAHVLGVPFESVRVKRMDNVLGANGGCTGGSMTSEAVCHAIKKACELLLERLAVVRADKPELVEWSAIVAAAQAANVDLTAKYLYRSVDLKTYRTYGITCAEVQLDMLTGNVQLRRVDILEDTGESLSPLMDVGQVEGAFVMGLGYWLTEAIVHDPRTGELLTNRTWTYKPPGAKDIPVDFRVRFLRNSPNEFGVLRSKATGEPPICMSVVVLFALRRALESARADSGCDEKWFAMGAPCTPDVLFQLAGNAMDQYRLNGDAIKNI